MWWNSIGVIAVFFSLCFCGLCFPALQTLRCVCVYLLMYSVYAVWYVVSYLSADNVVNWCYLLNYQ